MKNSILLTVSLSLLVVAGCSGGKVGLSGKVVYSDDRSPVPTGEVYFETDSFLARGIIQPDGTFVVGSIGDRDGIPPGTYRVSVRGAQKAMGEDAEGMTIYEPLIDVKFTSAATSGITIDITASTQNFEVPVDRYQK